jgi:DNA-binding transcriptional LysR family regulator
MLRKIDWESQIGRRLKLRDLHVFLTVVQRGSMAKAAQQLGVSQPSVSEVIFDLEHALGVRLVDRSARGVEPTIYGDALVKRSVAAFDELKQSIKDIEFLSDPTAGEVRIAAPIALAAGFVAAAIDRFNRRYPRVVCHLLAEGTPRPLEAREVDLLITFPSIVAPVAEVETEILYDGFPLFIVAAKKNPWSRRRKVRLADLINEPWALPPPDSMFGALLTDIFRAAGLDPPATAVVCVNGVACIALVAEGRFLSILPEFVFRFAGRDAIKALPINLPETRRTGVGIITLKNCTLTPVAQLFIDCAREVAKPMAMPRRRPLQKA